ncbi:MAG TPA: hypothetical protein VE961_26125 [Pyrinomonadaceae bacterium]|nr:hypothetical protein [Pyrinomonadaceae bacterium]
MSSNQDPARLIAERVARRLAGNPTTPRPSPPAANGGDQSSARPRARLINFVSANPPARTQPSVGSPAPIVSKEIDTRPSPPQVTQSPWLAPFAHGQSGIPNPQVADHPSQERFGVAEAAVSELVEFFENEKQCTVDPSGKPCDHCAMCSSRGF